MAVISFNAKKVYMIKTEKEYKTIVQRMEVHLQDSNNIENSDESGYIELNILSDLIADYEERTYTVAKPTLAEIIKLRMAEKSLNQKGLSELIGVSTSRVSEYLTGKSDPTLKVAREISKKLDIDAAIVLGV